METFEKTLELFLAELSVYVGNTPTIKINYKDKKILVVDCPSGFLKQLMKSDAICCHLGVDGLHVEYFKR